MEDFQKEDNLIQIPYVVFESAQCRSERTIHRLIAVIIITIILLFVSNGLWLHAWMQYDYSNEETTYQQDGEGYNNINTGTQGDVNNGASVDDPSQTETP